MKAILQSIRPEHCANILSGRKTIELRTKIPKIETPYKVYIYCTKHGAFMVQSKTSPDWFINMTNKYCGKVIGEYICKEISKYDFIPYPYNRYTKLDLRRLCLSLEDIHNYGKGKTLYGMHISDLVIYDKPKELSEFIKPCKYRLSDNECYYRQVECDFQIFKYNPDWSINWCACESNDVIARPPQSWCYVEEVEM